MLKALFLKAIFQHLSNRELIAEIFLKISERSLLWSEISRPRGVKISNCHFDNLIMPMSGYSFGETKEL